jgi:hypothetical protein
LGFCWQLLRKYQNVGGGSKNTSYEQSLLEWLRSVTKDYDDVNLDDGFKAKSFHNGKVCTSIIIFNLCHSLCLSLICAIGFLGFNQ